MLTEQDLFDEPHYLSLELLASQALISGDAFTAFKFADRRCRIAPSSKSYSYLLRGEALFQIGDKTAAVADLARAKYLAPDDIATNRRMLAWTKGSAQREAALALIRRDRNLDVLRKAIEILQVAGRRYLANAIVYDDSIGGWAVWQTDAPLEIMVTDGSNKLMALVDPDPAHAFSDLGNAANFEMRRPKSSLPQSITLSVGGEVMYSVRAPGNEVQPGDKLRQNPANRASHNAKSVSVIIPVFADFASTHQCIESLFAQDTSSSQIILVNDATPYPRIAKYLTKCAKHPSVMLLENERNLGYVGSINRALEQVEANDILLLNSDTIVPKNFIERLRVAAASELAVGTVTPLSNNGEYMSFPVANTPNPLASPHDLSELDAVAAKVNAGRLVDIPNGIGFCLYITRACFDAVGLLSEDYVRGYLEDADFCLRARARGFRNVCAPSIYVGHVGTRSFGADKRALVMRNLDVIERRFPSYQYQSAAFVLADPLAPSRQAIEREIPPRAAGLRLLITGAGDISVVARERARRLGLNNQVAIILEFHNDASGSRVKMLNPAGGIPQSLEYALSSAAECEAMIDYIRAMHPGALEILDPTSVPLTIMDRILNLGFPHDIFVADDAFLGTQSSSLAAAGSHQPAQSTAFNEERRLSRRWLDIARAAERVIVPSEQAYACARNSFPASKLMRGKPFIDAGRKNSRRRTQPVSRLGIMSIHGSGKEHALIGAVARALSLSALEVAITVIGSTLDDIALMQNRRTFVTGAVDPEDFSWVVKSYALQALFMPLTRPLFGHPLCEVGRTASLPVAFFDWSSRRLKPRENDLALDPLISFDNLIGRLSRWLSQPYDA